MRSIAADVQVEALAVEDTPPLVIGKTEFDGQFLRQDKGSIQPVVLDGRAPRGSHLGTLSEPVTPALDVRVRLRYLNHLK